MTLEELKNWVIIAVAVFVGIAALFILIAVIAGITKLNSIAEDAERDLWEIADVLKYGPFERPEPEVEAKPKPGKKAAAKKPADPPPRSRYDDM